MVETLEILRSAQDDGKNLQRQQLGWVKVSHSPIAKGRDGSCTRALWAIDARTGNGNSKGKCGGSSLPSE
jgi:hypothetical protein